MASHGKRFEVFDALVPGLAVRVSASGRKSFTLYHQHQGRMPRLGLGRYPDVLLEKARKIATQHRGRIYDGVDLRSPGGPPPDAGGNARRFRQAGVGPGLWKRTGEYMRSAPAPPEVPPPCLCYT